MPLTLTPETEARLLAEAARRGASPDAVIEALLAEAGGNAPGDDPADRSLIEEAREQERLPNVLAQLREEADALVPDPPSSPTRIRAMGKYAFVSGTSEDYAREKQSEITREGGQHG